MNRPNPMPNAHSTPTAHFIAALALPLVPSRVHTQAVRIRASSTVRFHCNARAHCLCPPSRVHTLSICVVASTSTCDQVGRPSAQSLIKPSSHFGRHLLVLAITGWGSNAAHGTVVDAAALRRPLPPPHGLGPKCACSSRGAAPRPSNARSHCPTSDALFHTL